MELLPPRPVSSVRLSVARPQWQHMGDTKNPRQMFSPNLSVEQLRTLIRSRDQDPLKPFGEACRRELKAMRAAV